jgi:hypothetical protein
MPYRLHIDIPLNMSEEEALIASQQILGIIANVDTDAIILNAIGVEEINYRLGHDDDRQKSNYFHKNENGHVNNKKSTIIVPTVNKEDPLDALARLDQEMGLL